MAKLSRWPWILMALARPSRQETYRSKPIVPERVHNLINLLSQTCAYAHEIAFTWCNTRDIHVGARLNKCDTAVRTCMMAIWPGDEATGSRSRPSRRLNANGNTLDEKGKKYGSFNPTSVNSFCPVAGRGRYSPQVGDFDPATGGGFSSGHRGSGTEILGYRLPCPGNWD
jgi:hypothetical protein